MVLASRIIPVVLMRGHEAVKGKGFDSWRSVGQVRQAIRVYQMRNVDELILLNIAATPQGKEPDFAFVKEFAGECFMPVTVGGGVRTLDHFRLLLANGADKVAINTAACEDPAIIARAAEKFGRQAVTVAIDVKDGHVQTHCGTRRTDLRPVEWARECERLGAGELIVTSVERDGTLAGYDTALVRSVASVVSVPVVACGGAGTYEHLKEGLDAGAHAVAAGALWTFTDATPAGAAEYLHKAGVRVRRKLAA
jgi:cyclase